MSKALFQPNGLAMFIGSQPLKDHQEASNLIFQHAPQIPNWAQLPVYPREGMVEQYMAGLRK